MEKIYNDIEKVLLQGEKLTLMIDNCCNLDVEVKDKDLFYLNFICAQLKNALNESKFISINSKGFNGASVFSVENRDTIRVDLSNPIIDVFDRGLDK